MGTAKYSRRTKFASWRLYRCWCVAWLLVCQFPLPIVHSHDSLAAIDPQAWQDHLQIYHPETCQVLDSCLSAFAAHPQQDTDLHWHWVLPGEFVVAGLGAQSNDRSVPIGSPFGVWGDCSGACAEQVTSVIVANSQVESLSAYLLEYLQASGWFYERDVFSLTCESPLVRPTSWSSFTQSYVDVPLRVLIGVCLV